MIIYIGNFFIYYGCVIKKHQIVEENDILVLNYVNNFSVPKRTQSVAFL